MSKFHVVSEKIVKLNVGGTFYTSTMTTLSKIPGSHLCRIMTGELPCPRDEKGSYFIDRDGQIFRYVLNYLRSDRLTIPFGFRDLKLLKDEADYYGLPDLAKQVDLAITSRRRNRRRRQRNRTSQSTAELHRVHEKNGDLYISDDDSDWFYD